MAGITYRKLPKYKYQLLEARCAGEEACRHPAGRLRHALADGPAAVQDLALAAGLEVGEALAELCRMELGGMVRSMPGHRFDLARRR